ncbi:unnamed protein product [Prorocentrum cordatum]|uniref:Uncharacterized protein n=2 Tax=Prorocentrum cordatum TaxID=2364126 RepID=A0ABN9PPH2_9DINO|nr:unnamed protein product [Polarella glacialis]
MAAPWRAGAPGTAAEVDAAARHARGRCRSQTLSSSAMRSPPPACGPRAPAGRRAAGRPGRPRAGLGRGRPPAPRGRGPRQARGPARPGRGSRRARRGASASRGPPQGRHCWSGRSQWPARGGRAILGVVQKVLVLVVVPANPALPRGLRRHPALHPELGPGCTTHPSCADQPSLPTWNQNTSSAHSSRRDRGVAMAGIQKGELPTSAAILRAADFSEPSWRGSPLSAEGKLLQVKKGGIRHLPSVRRRATSACRRQTPQSSSTSLPSVSSSGWDD